MSASINKPGMKGYSIPLAGGGDLHKNEVGGEHWTVRLKGGVSTQLSDLELERMIDNWRTNNLPLNFKAFEKL
jgi:hypothetical protein